MNTFDVVLAYVRAGLFGSQLPDGAREYMSDIENAKKVYRLSDKHDIAHLVGYGLQKCGQLNEADPVGAVFSKAQFMAVSFLSFQTLVRPFVQGASGIFIQRAEAQSNAVKRADQPYKRLDE